MTQFTFHITGGSPYDGELTIMAKTLKTAQRLANEYIVKYNEGHYGKLTVLYEDVLRVPFNPPCIVTFYSGEN